MSNLCYNCGLPHLPVPCNAFLSYCEICGHRGHIWCFCHQGPRKKEANFAYSMLCHNCDQWHLPNPCVTELHNCGKCGTEGHLDFYCPINPTVRAEDLTRFQMQIEAITGTTSSSSMVPAPVSRQDQIQTIKYATALETIRLLNETNDPAHVLEIMRTGTRNPTQLLPAFPRGYNAAPVASMPPSNEAPPIAASDGNQDIITLQPSPYGIFFPHHNPNDNQQKPRLPGRPRCEECKKKKKRCPHLNPDVAAEMGLNGAGGAHGPAGDGCGYGA
ncbi:hypothetical protein LTR85_008221 [Meristemomyces frigidus]|nr:hypothetical protein LTR85_008221 [Meristemomyces frigidus]